MKITIVSFAICLCLATWLGAQEPGAPAASDQGAAPATHNAGPAGSRLVLKRDTEVKLILGRQLSSTSSQVGDDVSFTVAEDVAADGRVLVPRGAVLKSTVTHAKPAHENANCRVLSSGVIDFSMPKLVLADGKQVQLDYEDQKGRDADDARVTAGDVAALVLVSPILVPLAAFEAVADGGFVLAHPQLLFHQAPTAPPGGCHDQLEDHTLEKGKILTYYVLRDVSLRAEDFPRVAAGATGRALQGISPVRGR